jgi:hypothetical protein
MKEVEELPVSVAQAAPPDPTAWALWDTIDEKWLGDLNGPRLFVSPTRLSRLGQMMCELAQQLLNVACCTGCKDRVIARRYDPTLKGVRTDVRIPLNL